MDIFAEDARNVNAQSPDDIARVAQSSMRKLKQEMREERFGVSAESLDDYLLKEGLQVGIMLGFFFGDTPHLYRLNLAYATAQKSRFYYEADGCGAILGEYLLGELSTPRMDMKIASAVALYVVEQVKKYDSACGGPTKIGVLRNDPGGLPVVGTYAQEGVNRCAAALLSEDAQSRPDKLKELHARIIADDFKLCETLYWNV